MGQATKQVQKIQEELNKKTEEPDLKQRRLKAQVPQSAQVSMHDPNFKTQWCPRFAQGQCSLPSSGCFYAHSQEEVRLNPEAQAAQQQQQMMRYQQMMGMPMGMMMPNQMMGMMG